MHWTESGSLSSVSQPTGTLPHANDLIPAPDRAAIGPPATPTSAVAAAPASDEASTRRELGVRRASLYVSIFGVVVLGLVTLGESDKPLHLIDDLVLVAVAVVAIVLIGLGWKRQTLSELHRLNKVLTGLFAVAFVGQVFGIFVEFNDPKDFGNDIPSLILVVLVLANRFE